MPKGNKIEVDGVVIENLPSTCFQIRITDPSYPDNFIVRGHISGNMRINYIRIIPGDRVKIELDPYDIAKGRITYRYKEVDPRRGPPPPPRRH